MYVMYVSEGKVLKLFISATSVAEPVWQVTTVQQSLNNIQIMVHLSIIPALLVTSINKVTFKGNLTSWLPVSLGSIVTMCMWV